MAESELRKSIGVELGGILHDAEESYSYLRTKHNNETKVYTILVGLLAWIGSFFALGIGAIVFYGIPHLSAAGGYLLILEAFLVSVAIGAASASVTYLVRHRRGYPFAELGALIAKMKGGAVTSEDGLKLIDATHQAMLEAKRGKIDSAFTYGLLAFILVGLFGFNAAIGLLAGVIVYLYFRYEAKMEYEKEAAKYERSKGVLLQNL